MPTILQVLPALDSGGVERGTVEMVEAIARQGWTPLVASQGGRLVPAVERAGGRHIALPLKTKTPWGIWRNATTLARLMREERVDLVHARSRAPAWSVLKACQATGIPFVTTYHGAYSEGSRSKRLYNSVMTRGARVIAASGFIADLVRRQHGVTEEKLRLIPRGIDPAVFDPHAALGLRVGRLAQAWGLPEGAQVVLLPARVSRWKGQSVLIEALSLLKRPNLFAVFVGSDQGRHTYVRELLDQAAAQGVTRQIKFVGHCADMPAALLLADVVVSASTEPEAFGRAVIEAQAMERVVIAAGHGGAAETITDQETGLLVPPGDVQALAGMIAAVLDAPAEARQEMGEQARASVLAHYTIAAMQAATIAVYEEVLASRS
ncbi:MAG TPA: glycosyltransferase family 4 protein [Acidisoma sp.]|uniref:glycosyltransferase family 4 protein n=1 Tax=Acidisoma sp. TaxID=1872115 RepID=UPI002CAB315A|nr:glycosyltransferase family 4 protein [Acidisoma sp.]HTI01415.1 glycosyltransferase family 4 protein [Acidisoma sp.]